MLHPRTRAIGVLSAFAGVAALAVLDGDADAKRRPRKPRRPRAFLSEKAPGKSRTPGTDSAGAPAFDARPVAEGAAGGADRMQTTASGVALVLSPTRALVANPWRGLVVVDTSDPDAPTALGSVSLAGSPRRLFAEGDGALVLADVWKDGAATTRVTSIDLSDDANPVVAGTVDVEGALVDATGSAAGVLLLTDDAGWWGPWLAEPARGGGELDLGVMPGGPAGARKAPASGASPTAPDGVVGDVVPWWGGSGTTRVATVTVGTGGVPSLGGAVEIEGWRVAFAFDGDTAVVARRPVEPAEGEKPSPLADGMDPATGGVVDPEPGVPVAWKPSPVELVAVESSPGGPTVVGTTKLAEGVEPIALDLAGPTLRLLASVDWSSWRLATFDVGSGAPSARGALDLAATWGNWAFSGDRFVWTTTVWSYGDDGIGLDPSGGGATPPRSEAGDVGVPAGPSSSLHVVDLTDPGAPAAGGSLELGTGWVGSLRAVPGGVVLSTTGESAATTILRVDCTDADVPAVSGTETLPGYWAVDRSAGDLLLAQGWRENGDRSWTTEAVPFDLSSGGLAGGGAFATDGWIVDAAWSSPLLAVAAAEKLTLVDLTDLGAPDVRGSLRLAVNVTDLEVLDAGTAAALVVDWATGDVEVRTFALPAADALAPLDTLDLGKGDARLFREGDLLHVLATDWRTGGSRLVVVDAGDPADLRERGSLDLATYPGQAFLVGKALVLLREAWTIAPDGTGAKPDPATADAFGACPTRWLRDELTAAIDVIDLSDPDAPRAAGRTRVRWDWGGQAILRDRTLYVPSYVERAVATPYGRDVAYSYGVRPIDLSDPLSPRVGPLVAVPGSLVAAADGKGRVLTVQYAWDEDGEAAPALHLVDLTEPVRARIVATAALAGWPGAVIAADDHVHVTTQSWDAEEGTTRDALTTYSLGDLSVTSTRTRAAGAWGGNLDGGFLFLRTWGWNGAVDAYDLSVPGAPAPAGSIEVDGAADDVEVAGSRAYVAAGYRGVRSLALE